VLDKEGKILAQTDLPMEFVPSKEHDLSHLKDGKILEETKNILLVSYHIEEVVEDEKNMRHHTASMGHMQVSPKPIWFLVGLDTSAFKRHYHDMVIQTIGTGAAFLLLGILAIVFLGIIQRYELAHLSIVKLNKIKSILGHFVPQTAKSVIEKDPEGEGLLDKYIQEATVLFLDIENFSLLFQKYSVERINRAIEFFFSAFLDIIRRNGGDVNETAGDGMMVIFLDSDRVVHPRNAIQTALQIQEQCLEMSQNENPALFPIRVNIGVHSGEVYLGSTKMRGSEGERWTYTASGPVTVLAARLADYASEGQILIGEETAGRVKELFSLTSIGKVPLKNIKDSGEIYQIPYPQP
jgi:class 3 adenylate cyclase